MLAIFIGNVCLAVGFVVLMLPLMATELSRPRDGAWGALTLLLGLVLLTNSDRLRGAPMLAVLLGGLLIFRLGFEVAQNRWQLLSEKEQNGFGSIEKWKNSLTQLAAAMVKLESMPRETIKVLSTIKPNKSAPNKKWVRPEPVKAQSDQEAQSSSNDVSAKSSDNSDELLKDSSEQESRPEPP